MLFAPVCGNSVGIFGVRLFGVGVGGVCFFGTSTFALSQPSLSPGIVGVSTQAVFTAVIPVAVACDLIVIVLLSPTFKELIFRVKVLSLISPLSALTKVIFAGAWSVTTTSFKSTFPLFETVIS